MALPQLTPEQRAAALVKAAAARRERAEVRNRLKHSGASLDSVLQDGQRNEVIGKMKVSALLESLPGVGKVRARQIMDRLGISESAARTRAREQAARGPVARVRCRPRLSRQPSPLGQRCRPRPRGWSCCPGPSGVGKSTVARLVRTRHPEVWLSVSVTTRARAPARCDGREYHFVDEAEFDRLIDDGELLEWATFAGHRYGTPRRAVLDRIAAEVPVLLEIDLQGARQIRLALPVGAPGLPRPADLGRARAPAGRPGHRAGRRDRAAPRRRPYGDGRRAGVRPHHRQPRRRSGVRATASLDGSAGLKMPVLARPCPVRPLASST